MSRQSNSENPAPRSQDTALSRLCRYYLACMGYDDEGGVSVFASSNADSADYVELKSLPAPGDSGLFRSEATRDLIGKLRKDRHRLMMYLGYPVALRKRRPGHSPAAGKNFKVEPVFLCPVEFEHGAGPRVAFSFPLVNLAVLRRFTAAEREAIMDELVELEKELGLTGDASVPQLGELGQRLATVRPTWPWKEAPNPAALIDNPPLHQIHPDGIFNRAVLVVAPRSPYTQGLEAELKLLAQIPADACAGTALGNWIAGKLPAAAPVREECSSIEVFALNREQREAVRRAFSDSLTVITGPPGTGKSQVVADLLIDAAWRGKRVLFASKNNKAVDVVEARLNALGPRQIVLRVGAYHYQLRMAEHLQNLLEAKPGPEDQTEFDAALRQHEALREHLARLDKEEKVLSNSLREKQPFIERLLWRFFWKRRLKRRSLAQIGQERAGYEQRMTNNAHRLWKAWLRLQPMRITAGDRQLLKRYTAILRMAIDKGSELALDTQMRQQYQKLFPQIGHLLPCWAVTSLSARGRIPFEAGFFDLVVFDEASQCDIASALPLLYRAKTAVVIGDPKQLSHISHLQHEQDQRLLARFELVAEYPHWAYSYNSLFDLASGFVPARDVVALLDHHRSHADIIQFSNEFFYQGNLRVVTAQERLNGPDPGAAAVRWVSVVGEVRQPSAGGAVNSLEAQAVIQELKRLLSSGYSGSVGVVSPFREQAALIRELALSDPALADKLVGADFLCETVHKFQGDERDVMIFSPVVSVGIHLTALTFLRKNGNLFNVGVTRARAALIVVGDRDAAMETEVEYLCEFARYVRNLENTRRKPAHIMPV